MTKDCEHRCCSPDAANVTGSVFGSGEEETVFLENDHRHDRDCHTSRR